MSDDIIVPPTLLTTPAPAPVPKMGLVANRDLHLCLYVYIARLSNIIVPVPQLIELIFAFTEDEAMASLQQKYPSPPPDHPERIVMIDPKGKIPVANLLALIEQHAGGQPTVKVKTKADYYAELIDDLKKIASDQVWPDGELEIFNKVLNQLDEIVKQSQMFQQL